VTARNATVATALAAAVGAVLAVGVPTPAAAAGPVVPAADLAISFTADATTAYGTLHVPAHRAGQRMPAALLLPGSGPTDRDGDQPPAYTPHTHAQLAAAFGALGVVTFRFDKYGTGQTGLGAFAEHPETIDYPAFVRQADAAYRLLARQPGVDRRQMRLVGHSEGAMTALVVATTAQPRPVGVALLQPQAMRLLDVITVQLHDQLVAAVAGGQLPPDQLAGILLAIDGAVADLRAHRPVDTAGLPPSIAALFQALGGVNRRFVETDDAVDPAEVARRLAPGTSALLTCGTADPQVPCDMTTALTAALRAAHTTGPGRVVLAGVDHSLSEPAQPGTLAPSVIAALERFMASP
jgi:uncharacterized protein